MTFDCILNSLKQGHVFARLDWDSDKMEVIFKQNEDHISKEFVPNLHSMPFYVKRVYDTLPDKTAIHFKGQVIKIDLHTGEAKNYIPDWEDIFADDWYQIDE